jgi:hypothetical protein
LASLEPPRLIQRYERPRPGELVHLDIRKLGRIGRVGQCLAAHGIVVERLLNGPMRGPTAAPTGEREPSMTTYSSTTFADHTAR